jgi:D-glycero-D-manno-heptose 1,7-bisphosphate phosphatase
MPEIVLVCGCPAAGKTSFVDQYPDHKRLNRDTEGGSLDDIANALASALANGDKQSYVLDNTYTKKDQRKKIVDIGKKFNIPVRVVWLNTTIEDAAINAVCRMIKRHGSLLSPAQIKACKDPNVFPPAALFSYRKQVELPHTSEGFASVEFVEFKRKYDSTYINKAVFFDFDGTLRKSKSGRKYPITPDDVEVLEGRTKILLDCEKQGYRLLGVSNQSGISKGEFTEEDARKCFERTNELLGVDIEYAFCPHAPAPIQCFCRKPQTGLVVQFIEKYKLNPALCKFVGDMTSDNTTATRAGIPYVNAEKFFGG